METKSKYEQLRHASGGFQKSTWLDEAEHRKADRGWIENSQKIALLVLRTIRAKGISQKDLAELLNISLQQVNKWLKGSENFTFETIYKLEQVLDIQLMSINEVPKTANN